MTRKQFGVCVVNSSTHELFEMERVDSYDEAVIALAAYATASPQDDLCVFDRLRLAVVGFKRGGRRLAVVAGGAR